jgi:hypothetical protein
MKFLRHLLGITKLDKENNQCVRGKTGAHNAVKGKAIPLQAWTGPEGSRRLRLPDFKTVGT